MSPVLRLVHHLTINDPRSVNKTVREMALAALDEHDKLRLRVAELERELIVAKRAILYPMTDLA